MFLVSIFPLKLLFNFIGYDYYDSFRNSFMGYSNPFWFYCLLTIFALVSITAAILIYKVLRKKIIFPLLFFLSCIIVYIPPGYVAERFTYLASAGICLLLVLTLVNIKQQKYAMLIFYFFFLINFAALFLKGNSFYTYTSLYNNSLKDLYNQIISSKQVSGAIMIENLPTPFYGNLFVSMQNFNDTFKYFNPSDTIEFYLKNNITPIDVIKPLSRTFAFDIQTFKFNPINK
jgi:hypothetical protein